MNKCLLLIFVLLITANNSFAWNSIGHKKLVENVYYSMPRELQEKLNLTLMKEGAVAPDLVFHDVVKHHYPYSKDLAYKWLSNISNISEFAFNFGVASHYISDSFVAPHYISHEDPKLHSEFESQVNYYSVKTKCSDYNYTLDDLAIGAENKKDWEPWLKTKDKSIPQKEFEEAQKFVYTFAIKKLNYSCTDNSLVFEEKPLLNFNRQEQTIAYILFLGLIFIWGLIFLRKK